MDDYSAKDILNSYMRGMADGRTLEREDAVNWLDRQGKSLLRSPIYLASCIERGEHLEKGDE